MACCPSKEIHGYDASRFEEAVDAIFHCSICFDVLKEPRSCRNNDHLFCLDCINEYLKGKSQTCPKCQQDLSMNTLCRPRESVSDYISKLKINCDYAKQGCPKYICVESLENHVKDCGYAPVVCSNEHCGKEVNKREISHHENEVCEHRKVTRHGYEQGRDFESLPENIKEFKNMNEKVEKRFKEINEAVQQELKNVNAKVEEKFRNMNEKIKGNRIMNEKVETERREMKKEVEGVKENVREVKKDMDEVKVMISKMMEKLNQMELLRRLPSLTEGMLSTPREDILITGDSWSTEIYSWEKNAWFEVSPMNDEHEAASSFIQNDQLFVVGGWDSRKIESLNLNESPLKWMVFPADLPYGCSDHHIVVYQQGIIHIGGYNWEKHEVSNAISELQLAPFCTLKELGRMSEPRECHGAAIFEDKVLILGGQFGENKDDDAIDIVSEFDLREKKCSKKRPLPQPLTKMATVSWRDKIVVLGGLNEKGEVLNDVFMYDCKSGETTALPSMMEKRFCCSVVITGDTVVVMGGSNEKWDELSSVECFTMGSSEWKYLPAMNEERCRAIAEALPSTRKYV